MRDSGDMKSVAGRGDDCTDSLLLLERAAVLFEWLLLSDGFDGLVHRGCASWPFRQTTIAE